MLLYSSVKSKSSLLFCLDRERQHDAKSFIFQLEFSKLCETRFRLSSPKLTNKKQHRINSFYTLFSLLKLKLFISVMNLKSSAFEHFLYRYGDFQKIKNISYFTHPPADSLTNRKVRPKTSLTIIIPTARITDFLANILLIMNLTRLFPWR